MQNYQKNSIEQVIISQKLDLKNLRHELEKGSMQSEPDAVYYGQCPILIEHTKIYIQDRHNNPEQQKAIFLDKLLKILNEKVKLPSGWCIGIDLDLTYFCQNAKLKNEKKWNDDLIDIIQKEMNQKIELFMKNNCNIIFEEPSYPSNWKGPFNIKFETPEYGLWDILEKTRVHRQTYENFYTSDHLCYTAHFQPNDRCSHIFQRIRVAWGSVIDMERINTGILDKSEKIEKYKEWAKQKGISNPFVWLVLDISQEGSGFYLFGHNDEINFDISLLRQDHGFDEIFVVENHRVFKFPK